MINFLKLLFWSVLVFMIYKIVDTSLQSSLFEELPKLVKIPWMEATLWDFYANVLAIFLWIAYKEKNHFLKLLWLVCLFFMGSVATCIYILKELHTLKEGEGLRELLIKQKGQ